jgi:hypothetical protein
MAGYASDDVDSFSCDPSAYRPTNLTYSISPASGTYNVSNALNWNANWSLQQMAYTDGSPSPLSQTCTYSADDLSRIASVNCGSSTWAQNFSPASVPARHALNRRFDLQMARKIFLIGALVLVVSAFGAAQQAAPAGSKTVPEKLSYPANARLLMIEAEDLGMAHSIDKASFEALEKGWVTTAGILVPAPWFPEVARWARNHPAADLGIQLDLNSDWSSFRWRPVSNLPKGEGIVDPSGYMMTSDQYVAVHADPASAEGEVRAQLDLAKKAGISLSHLDKHMNTMILTPRLAQIYCKLGEETGLPVMIPSQYIKMRGAATQKTDIYSFAGIEVNLNDFPANQLLEIKPGLAKQDWLSAYEKTLDALPPGVYLLSVHLGYNDDELQAMTWDHPNWGAEWRQNDLDVVSSPEFQKFLKDKGFILVGWKDLQKAMPAKNPQAN